MKRLNKKQIVVSSILFGVGVVLLFINIAGLIIPLRNPAIYTEPRVWLPSEPIMTEKQFYQAIERANETDAEYAAKVCDAVHRGIAHYWFDEGTEKYNLRIPIQENWVIFLMNKGKYEFQDWRRSVERGVGMCGEKAIVVCGILKERGIDAKVMALDGHVVATSQVDKENNKWWILGADYGVVIPYSPSELAQSPEVVAQYYLDKGYNANIAKFMGEIWEKGWNDSYSESVLEYNLYIENSYYVMKWAIPLILIFIPLLAVCLELFVK